MSVVAAAVIGSAAIGAYSSNRAADKAADATKKGLDQSSDLAQQSRDNAYRLYQQGSQNAKQGLMSAFDFYKQAAQTKYQPFILGNAAAQGVIGQGAQQANNAILGLPVDMSFASPQTINPDLSLLKNAQLPILGSQMSPPEVMGPDQLGAQQGLVNSTPKSFANRTWR